MAPDELKQWKLKFNFNQVQLAEMLGVSKMCVSRWERGERKIPPFLIYALQWLELKGGESKIKGKKKRKEKS
jgi:predicted transcriptional regulator